MRNSRSETEPVLTKSSQNTLRISSVQVEGVEHAMFRGEASDRVGRKINSACVSFPPFPSLGFSFSIVDFVVFDLMSGYLSKNSLLSLNSTRTLNSWLAISVLIALTSAGCLAISASQCYSVPLSFPCATSSRVYTQWHMAPSLKPSLWPLVTGIYPIPSAGSVHDDLFPFLHAFTPLITFWSNL